MRIPATSFPQALLGGLSDEAPNLRGATEFQAFVDAESLAPTDQNISETVDVELAPEAASNAEHENKEAADNDEKSQVRQGNSEDSAPSERPDIRKDAEISSDAPSAELVIRHDGPMQRNLVVHAADSPPLSASSSTDSEVQTRPSEQLEGTNPRPQIRHAAEAALMPGDSFQITQPGPLAQRKLSAETPQETILAHSNLPKGTAVLQAPAAPPEPTETAQLLPRQGGAQNALAAVMHIHSSPNASSMPDAGEVQADASPAALLGQGKNALQELKMSAISDSQPGANARAETSTLGAQLTLNEFHSARITQDIAQPQKEASGLASSQTSWPQSSTQADRGSWPQTNQPLVADQMNPPGQSSEAPLMQSDKSATGAGVDPLSARPITDVSTNAHTVSGSAWVGAPETRVNVVQSDPQLPRPQHIAAQLSTAFSQAQGDVFDLQLSPQELGKVRLSLTANEQSSVLHVITDRPETLDLLRRHIGVLENDLRSLGHDNLTLRFGTGAGTEGGNQQLLHRQTAQPEASKNPQSPTSETPESQTPRSHVTLAQQQHVTDTLDVRL